MNRLQHLDIIRTLIENNGGEFKFPSYTVPETKQKVEYRLDLGKEEWEKLTPSTSPFKLESSLPVKFNDMPVEQDRLGIIAKIKDKRLMLAIMNEIVSQPGVSYDQKVEMIMSSEEGLFFPRDSFKEDLRKSLTEHLNPEHILGKLALRGQTFIFTQHHKGVSHPGYGERITHQNGDRILTNHKADIVEALSAAANKEYMSPDAFVIEAHGEFIARNLSVTEPHCRQETGVLSVNVERKLRDTLEIYREIGKEAFELFSEGLICREQRPDQNKSTITRAQGLSMLRNTLNSSVGNSAPEPQEPIPEISPRKIEITRLLSLREEMSKWRTALDIIISQTPESPSESINKRWEKIVYPTVGTIGTVPSSVYETALGRIKKVYGEMVDRNVTTLLDNVADKIEDKFATLGEGEVASELHKSLAELRTSLTQYQAVDAIPIITNSFEDSTLDAIEEGVKDALLRGEAYPLPEKALIDGSINRGFSRTERRGIPSR
jgi:hypothetical protein